ncbi:hypothetical protein FK518_30530, partial [Klebsiella pneumoniae]|nr:hypothetical protein [Klebsiella pneumoniae]
GALSPPCPVSPPPALGLRGAGGSGAAAITHRIAAGPGPGGRPSHASHPLIPLRLRSAGKCRGLRTARKLRSHRRDQKWHDKQYKKAHLGTALKA